MRNVQKILGSVYFGLPGNKNLLNIITHQGNALSVSLFELSYLFKIEGLFLVPQVLIYCLYDAFIASILCTTKMGFQFWEQIEVRRSCIRRIWGGEEGYQIHIQSQQSWQHVMRGQNTVSQFSSPLSCYFLT